MTRRRADRSRHRTASRYGRVAMLVASLAVTFAAVVAAVGYLPYPGDVDRAMATSLPRPDVPAPAASEPPAPSDARPAVDASALPARSGQGRRIVYAMAEQRVWLVRADDTVRHTYPVSGSRLDNLDAGRYEVYSRSVDATSYTGSSTMRHMVRFTQGERAAIGFHDIPLDADGHRVQSAAELGTPLSDGCIRQRPRDAKQLWTFAPVGTDVVVLT